MKQSRLRLLLCVFGLGAATVTSRATAQVSEAAGIRAIVPFELGRFDLGVGGTVHRVATSVGPRTPFSFETTVRLPTRSGGFWLGSTLESAHGLDSLPIRPLLSAGMWRSFSHVRISVGGAAHAARLGGRASTLQSVPRHDSIPRYTPIRDSIRTDTGYVYRTIRIDTGWTYQNNMQTEGDSGAPSRTAYWSDLEGRVTWRAGRASMEAVVGARPRVTNFAPAVWGRVAATYPVSERFALTAAAGAEPAHLGLGVPASTFVSIALRVRPWRPVSITEAALPTAFVLQRSSDSSYRILYAAPSASTVELSGDFDGWRPVSLTETRPGVWEATLALKPGTYHVNLRVDGGRWLPPPGLPQAADDFNGAVGVLVVR